MFHTKTYREEILGKAYDRPFHVHSDFLELLTPSERNAIRRENRNKDMLKDTLKESDKEQLSTKGKLFIIDTLPNLFSIHSDINTTDEFLALVRDWLDIFLIHFELGYYLEEEFLDVLRALKNALLEACSVNSNEFVLYLYSYLRKFIKSALFFLYDKMCLELSRRKIKKKFKELYENLIKSNSDSFTTVEKGLNFEGLLKFFKRACKHKHREIEEEIGMLQEMYFNTCFGAFQLKGMYSLNWQKLDRDVTLMEYFFNIKENFLEPKNLQAPLPSRKSSQYGLSKLPEIKKLFSSGVHSIDKNTGKREDSLPPTLKSRSVAFRRQQKQLEAAKNNSSSSRQNKSARNQPQLEGHFNFASLQASLATLDFRTDANKLEPDYERVINVDEIDEMLTIIMNIIFADQSSPKKLANEFPFYFAISVGPKLKYIADVFLETKRPENLQEDKYAMIKEKLARTILRCPYFMSCFSYKELCTFIGHIYQQAIPQLANLAEYSYFNPLFTLLVEVIFKWVLESTTKWKVISEKEKGEFYNMAGYSIMFLSKIIECNRKNQIDTLEKELLLFDLLFTIYHCVDGGSILAKFNLPDMTHPKIDKEFSEFLLDLSKGKSIKADSHVKLENCDYIFISLLLASMSEATSRFYLTESSELMRKDFSSFIDDLLEFTGTKRLFNNDEDLEEKDLFNSKSVDAFMEGAYNSTQMIGEHSLTLLPIVIKLQNNLLFRANESLLDKSYVKCARPKEGLDPLDKSKSVNGAFNRAFVTPWIPTQEQQIHYIIQNIYNCSSKAFREEFTSEVKDGFARKTILELIDQLFIFFRKLTIQDASVANFGIPTEIICFINLCLRKLCKLLNIDIGAKSTEDMIFEYSVLCVADILDIVMKIANSLEHPIDKQRFKRISIHLDETNLQSVKSMTRYSNKFNPGQFRASPYYALIFNGKIEMEVDEKELTMGLARTFIKIFNKMLFDDDYTKFRKLRDFLDLKIENEYKFLQQSLRPGMTLAVKRFLVSIRTSYFYNEKYSRAMIIFEKLFDEIAELKKNLYNESVKNLMIVSHFSLGKHIKRAFPYLKGLNTICLSLFQNLQTSVFHSNTFGVIYSRFFLVVSLLNNLTQDNFNGFKRLLTNGYHRDLQLPYFKEEVDDLRQFEKKRCTFLISLCCRLEDYFQSNDFDRKYKLKDFFIDPVVTSTFPIVSQILALIEAMMWDEPIVMQYVYYKLFTRYLLKMLFFHEEIGNIDVIFLKKAICKLLSRLCMNEVVLDSVLKNHYDLRYIYDYTILITKMHLWCSMRSSGNFFGNLFLKKNDPPILEAPQGAQNSFVKLIAQLIEKTQHIDTFVYNPAIFSEKCYSADMTMKNMNLFGGFNYAYKSGVFDRASFDKLEDMNNEDMLDCYKKSDNRDLGFQFINALVRLMNFTEQKTGIKLWSTKKELARIQFEVEPQTLPKSKLFELKTIYFLSKINRQIEIVDQNGRNVIISFRKYPEVYTIDDLNPLDFISNFRLEDFRRDLCSIIPDLYVKTNIQYTIMQESGFMYNTLRADSLSKYPVILWLLNLILNLIILGGRVNPRFEQDSQERRSSKFDIAERVMVFVILAFSTILVLFWAYTRYMTIKMSNNAKADVAVKNDNQIKKLSFTDRLLRPFLTNPYYKFISSTLMDYSSLSILIHPIITVVGLNVHPFYYTFGVLMFIFFSETTKNVLKSITTNLKEIFIAVVITLMLTYIYAILMFFYYFENLSQKVFGDNSRPCITLWKCYMNVISYGIRLGGGIGEATQYVSENDSWFEETVLYQLTFFFLINIISLNIIFGIIIDTFSQKRQDNAKFQQIMSNICLICNIRKSEFESNGISFEYHMHVQHKISDYVAYLIRLHIIKDRIDEDIDYYVMHAIDNNQVSWLPSNSSQYIDGARRDKDKDTSDCLDAGGRLDKEALISKMNKLDDRLGVIFQGLQALVDNGMEMTAEPEDTNNFSKYSISSRNKKPTKEEEVDNEEI